MFSRAQHDNGRFANFRSKLPAAGLSPDKRAFLPDHWSETGRKIRKMSGLPCICDTAECRLRTDSLIINQIITACCSNRPRALGAGSTLPAWPGASPGLASARPGRSPWQAACHRRPAPVGRTRPNATPPSPSTARPASRSRISTRPERARRPQTSPITVGSMPITGN